MARYLRLSRIDTEGPEKYVRLPTSNRHIIPLRDSLEAYSLTLQAFLSHPHAAHVISRAHSVSTYFMRECSPAAALRFTASALHITTPLQAATTASYVTAVPCLRSMVANRPALERVLHMSQADTGIHDAVAVTVRDGSFWKVC